MALCFSGLILSRAGTTAYASVICYAYCFITQWQIIMIITKIKRQQSAVYQSNHMPSVKTVINVSLKNFDVIHQYPLKFELT